MSVWQEDQNEPSLHRRACMSDVHFKIDCERLPIDHAFQLSSAIFDIAPWLETLPSTAIQAVHVAASQNGWERPDIAGENELLLSKRTRLKIRIDKDYVEQLIESLRNQTLSIGGNKLRIISGQGRALHAAATLFSRYTCFEQINSADVDEKEFVDAVVQWCETHGYSPTKLLCGKGHLIASKAGSIFCRSVMLADVPTEHSLALQEHGIGALRWMGCGILLPHKDTGAVHQTNSSGSNPAF